MIRLLSVSKAATLLDVEPITIRRWDKQGLIKTVRTAGGHRRIPYSEIERLQQEQSLEPLRTISLVYCRCSTQKQVDNLERQVGRVLIYCAEQKWEVEIFKEIGSGLNEKRRQYNKFLQRIANKDIKRVIIEYKDRLTRYGFKIFEVYCKSHNVEIIILNEAESLEFEQELTQDIISLITSYSARLYGRRGAKIRKLNAKNNKTT